MKKTISLLAFIAVGTAAGAVYYQSDTTKSTVPVTQKASSAAVATNETMAAESVVTADPDNSEDGVSTALYRPALTVNTNLAWEFSQDNSGWVNMGALTGAGGTTPGQLELNGAGKLNMHVYAFADERWILGAKFDLDKLDINQQQQPYAEAVSKPFLISLKPNGELIDLQLASGLPAEARQFVQQTLDQFQFVSPLDQRSQWSTRELDFMGVYGAEYQQTQGGGAKSSLQKKKNSYLQLQQGPLAASRIEVPHSRSDMTADADTGWIKRVSTSETTRTYINEAAFSEVVSEFRANKSSYRSSYQFPASLDEFKSTLESAQHQQLVQELKTDPKLDQLAAGMKLQDALDYYLQHLEKNPRDKLARKFMINYLRKYPTSSEQLASRLNQPDSGLAQEEELFLWYALAQAGTELNQAALLAAAMDGSALRSTRMRAIAAMHTVQQPSGALVDGLWQLNADSDGEISAMAVLALGSEAEPGKLSQESSPGAIIEEFSSRLLAADLEDTKLLLSGLHNTQNPQALPIAESYLGHADLDVRSGALRAVINVGTATAFDTAFSHYESENAEVVRKAALSSLYQYKEDPQVNDWVRQQLDQDLTADAVGGDLQLQAVDILGNTLESYPQNETFLRDWAEQAADPRLKKQIYKYVSPLPFPQSA